MSKSGIEWTGYTWNPTKGCSLKTPGCTNCYAMKEAYRFGFNPKLPIYHGLTKLVNGKPVWTGAVRLSRTSLFDPLARKTPTTWFVNSMSDLFHEDVPDDWRDEIFAVMALCPQHTFQVLTKRSDVMRCYVNDPATARRIYTIACDIVTAIPLTSVILIADPAHEAAAPAGRRVHLGVWPLPNVWLGVSTEDQRRADERIPDLLATPAAVRFISAEPLLGPIDLTRIIRQENGQAYIDNALAGFVSNGHGGSYGPKLDQVIVGGESGPGARPMHPDWPRALRDQCTAAGVQFFFKQWGAWEARYDRDRQDPDWRRCDEVARWPNSQWLNLAGGQGFHGDRVVRVCKVGKARAGRMLDGIEHNGMPEQIR